ncbi:unnamed protein product, partial [Laminaria digitata]
VEFLYGAGSIKFWVSVRHTAQQKSLIPLVCSNAGTISSRLRMAAQGYSRCGRSASLCFFSVAWDGEFTVSPSVSETARFSGPARLFRIKFLQRKGRMRIESR